MHIFSSPSNLASPGVTPGSPSSNTPAKEKEGAVVLKSSSTFFAAAKALGGAGALLVTGPVKLLRGSSLIFGKFIMQLGSTMWEQLKKMAKSPSSSTPKTDPLKNVQAFVKEVDKTKKTFQKIKQKHQENQEKLLEKFKRQYPTKYPSGKTSKTPSSEPTTPPKGLARADKLKNFPPVPNHEIKIQKDTTTDLSSKKEKVVQDVFSELKKMHTEEEYNSILDKLYNKHSEPLNQKTDAKTVELIGKEYDEQQLVK